MATENTLATIQRPLNPHAGTPNATSPAYDYLRRLNRLALANIMRHNGARDIHAHLQGWPAPSEPEWLIDATADYDGIQTLIRIDSLAGYQFVPIVRTITELIARAHTDGTGLFLSAPGDAVEHADELIARYRNGYPYIGRWELD